MLFSELWRSVYTWLPWMEGSVLRLAVLSGTVLDIVLHDWCDFLDVSHLASGWYFDVLDAALDREEEIMADAMPPSPISSQGNWHAGFYIDEEGNWIPDSP